MHGNVPVRFGRGRLDSLAIKGLAAYLMRKSDPIVWPRVNCGGSVPILAANPLDVVRRPFLPHKRTLTISDNRTFQIRGWPVLCRICILYTLNWGGVSHGSLSLE